MDIPVLAQNLTTFLAPFLPYLVKAGVEAGKEAAKKLGGHLAEDTWKQAQTLWGKLRGHKEVEKAAQDVAAMPEDSDAQAALRLQLKKLLAENEALAEELARLLEQAQPSGSAVTAAGERSVAVGGSVSGSTIITGDGNVVGDHSRGRVVKK